MLVEPLEDRTVLSHSSFFGPFPVPQSPVSATAFVLSDVAIDSDAQGNFVIAWTHSLGPDSDNIFSVEVRARLFSRDGVALTDEFLVDVAFTTLNRGSVHVDVAMEANGDFAVAYDTELEGDGDRDLMVAFYNSLSTSPVQVREIDPDVGVNIDAFGPSIDANNAGYVLAYGLNDDPQQFTTADVVARRFDANGNLTSGRIQVSQSGSEMIQLFGIGPDVDSSQAGNQIVVTWLAGDFSNQQVVYSRFVSGSFATPIDVGAANAGFSTIPAVGVAGDGSNFVITWNEFSGLGPRIQARVFSPGGATIAGPFTVNVDVPASISAPEIASAQDGTFAITWARFVESESAAAFDGSLGEVFGVLDVERDPSAAQVLGRIFNPDGSPESPELVVSDPVDGSIGDPAAAIEPSGDNVVFAWSQEGENFQDNDVFAHIFRREPPPPPPPPPDPFVPFDPAPLIALVRSLPADQPVGQNLFFLAASEETMAFFFFSVSLPDVQPTSIIFNTFNPSDDLLGRISGRVFQDLDEDGKSDENEPGLRQFIVFIDKNENGRRDPDEEFTRTDEKGYYVFDPLDLREHTVRVELDLGGPIPSLPVAGAYKVLLDRTIPAATDKNFGLISNEVAPAGARVPKVKNVDDGPNKQRPDGKPSGEEKQDKNNPRKGTEQPRAPNKVPSPEGR